MCSCHVFFTNFARDEGHLDLLEFQVENLDSYAGTSAVLFSTLLTHVTDIIQSADLDQLFSVQSLGLFTFDLQSLHFHRPELLLLHYGKSLTFDYHSALFPVFVIDFVCNF